MLAGRSSETTYLQNTYDRAGSQILVIYGREGIGKTSFLKDFAKDKDFTYFLARSGSFDLQMKTWAKEISEDIGKSVNIHVEPSFASIFDAITSFSSEKKILIIDEFHHLVRSSEDFLNQLIRLMHEKWENQSLMILLCSSEVSWVENGMVPKIGEAAYEISGFLKIRELSFGDLVHRFPKCDMKTCIGIYSVLGCVPGLWRYFNSSLSLRENICRTILKKGTVLYDRAISEIDSQLREPSVYCTILEGLASGNNKLNDLFLITGYNRAKISVYLKNLMELEIVEKDSSVDTEGRDNVQKGIYRITNHLICFYFRFVYPNLSRLEFMNEYEFYDLYIADGLDSFISDYFADVCREYMVMMDRKGMLPFKDAKFGHWLGKTGSVDILGICENGITIAGICNWDKDEMSYEDYEWLKFCLKQARIRAGYYYLFSATGFSDRLIEEEKETDLLTLIDLNKM